MKTQIDLPPHISTQDILSYEIAASWWACRVKWKWAQSLASRWFAFKVSRKHRRYIMVRYKEAMLKKYRETTPTTTAPP